MKEMTEKNLGVPRNKIKKYLARISFLIESPFKNESEKNKQINNKNNKKCYLQLMPTDIDQQLQTFVSVRGCFTSWTTLFIAHYSFIIVN